MLVVAILGMATANAQIDPGYVEYNYYNFGTTLSEQGHELEVGFDLMKSDKAALITSFGVLNYKETLSPTFGVEANVDVIDDALQFGAGVKSISPFHKDATFTFYPQIVSELGDHFRFKIGYGDFNQKNRYGFNDESLIFGVGFRF